MISLLYRYISHWKTLHYSGRRKDGSRSRQRELHLAQLEVHKERMVDILGGDGVVELRYKMPCTAYVRDILAEGPGGWLSPVSPSCPGGPLKTPSTPTAS